MRPHCHETRLFIDNQHCSSSKEETFRLCNPCTEEHLADIAIALKEDVDRAVECAQKAQPAWAALPVQQRAAHLNRLADLLDREATKINEVSSTRLGEGARTTADPRIQLDAICMGKPSVLGESSLLTPGQVGLSVRQPFGVCGDAILPWNVPITMQLAAVAAGNTLILKSSEKAPLSAAFVGHLIAEAGFPPGVIQILSGGGATGKLLAEHMHIRKISFTGSVRTGRLVAQAAAASNLKNVSLELGGKSPTLVFPDADLRKAIPACSQSIQFNSGQACIAGSRIYVHESISHEFIKEFKKVFGTYQHGDPLDKSTTLGPIADEIQVKKVVEYIEIGKRDGKLEMGGVRVESKGFFIEPTVFLNVPDHSKINVEEIFGPVVIIHTFKHEHEAIKRANDTEYGLYASIFTRDVDRALRVSKALEAGTVTVNTAAPTVSQELPFGGWKGSGMGREVGIDAVKRWTEEKTILIKVDEKHEC
ncbi:betaine-aldehyde dehydrogenase [Leucosporidium creatinivorum]|uniref:Betaine-aldehyde dehydrogenase n=1 Tax=Leucosporidium creatinivorum TaxID=106004 RepID=A0A1Y2CCM4_9BASI|nr:betaine-aldehyde dehydrogenase [Leucosporidium creatinivorum]